MSLDEINRSRWGRVLALGVLLTAACTDDGVVVTDSASGTESSSGTTDNPTTNSTVPTTDPTTTNSTVPTTTDTATDTATTSPVTTTDTTTGTTDTTTGTTDTTTDSTTGTTTDTTTGAELVGKSVTQTVNGGTVASSPGFRMVFTIGQPTQNQGVYTSANFRLQGGLIGANGNPP